MKSSSTDLALQAFNARPTRVEALSDLSRHYRERGMNEVAALFARRGVAIPPSDDLLFVETWKRADLLEDLSISGYYSVDSETRALAHSVCEELSLSRVLPRETVETARRNLFWFAPKLVDLASSWRARQIEFEAPRGWRAMNPSVVRHQGKTRAIIRCVNYWIKPDGGYTFPDSEPAISTRNFLVELTSTFEVAPGAVEVAPDLGPVLYGGVLGLEDLRLFTWHDDLRFIACARQMNEYGRVEQVTGRLGLDGTVEEMEVIRRPWVGPAEKNWMPIIGAEDRFDEPHLVYRCDPMTVVSASLESMPEGRSAAVAADNFSGSSQLIPFDDGWLCMTHEPLASPINGRRLNQQRFVQFDRDLTLVALSRRFHFQLNEEIEYVVGLCWHSDESKERLVISYGSHDRQAWIGTLDADEVRGMLRLTLTETKTNLVRGEPRPLSKPDSQSVASGHDLLDYLALDRKAAPEERERARRELHAHIKPIGEVFPSWSARRLRFSPPDGYAALAPSMVHYDGRILATVRCINYRVGNESEYYRISDGAWMMEDNVKPNSLTYLLEFDGDLADRSLGRLKMPWYLKKPVDGAKSLGLEDLRTFSYDDDLWAMAAFGEQSADGLSEQWLIRLDLRRLGICDARHVALKGRPRRAEKNWMPIIGTAPPCFIYSCDPTIVVDGWGLILSERTPRVTAEHWHGGSQAIPFAGGWLAVVHWQQVLDPRNQWVDFEYRNRFVWFDADFNLACASPPWSIPTDDSVPPFPRRFQLAHGLMRHPFNGEKLIMGYVLYENEPWVALVDQEEVRRRLVSLR